MPAEEPLNNLAQEEMADENMAEEHAHEDGRVPGDPTGRESKIEESETMTVENKMVEPDETQFRNKLNSGYNSRSAHLCKILYQGGEVLVRRGSH